MGVFGGGGAVCCRTPTVAAMLRSRISLEVRKIPRLTIENAILFFVQIVSRLSLVFPQFSLLFLTVWTALQKMCNVAFSLRFLLLNSFRCFYCNAHLTTGFFGRCTTKKCFSFILVRFNLLHFYFCMGKLFFRFLWGFESFLKIVFFLLGRKHNRSLKRSNSFWKPSLRKEKKSTSTPVKAERSFSVCVRAGVRVCACMGKRGQHKKGAGTTTAAAWSCCQK